MRCAPERRQRVSFRLPGPTATPSSTPPCVLARAIGRWSRRTIALVAALLLAACNPAQGPGAGTAGTRHMAPEISGEPTAADPAISVEPTPAAPAIAEEPTPAEPASSVVDAPAQGAASGAKQQPGYRASLYDTVWPVDMANLNRTNAVVGAGLPSGFACEQVRVDTVEMPFPAFAYTRDLDEVFVLGGLSTLLSEYDAKIDGRLPGLAVRQPHLTKYDPTTGRTLQLDLTRGTGFPYLGGALVHENGYVYVVSQAYLYKIDPETMKIADGVELPRADVPGGPDTTTYNGLSASRTGDLLTKFFTVGADASTFMAIDPDTLEITASADHPGASPRLTVDLLESGEEHLYHLNQQTTYRFEIGKDALTFDEDWVARFDPYQTGLDENKEPTSPVIAQGRVHYTTNTTFTATEPMRIFWQDAEASYSEADPPLTGPEMLEGVEGAGWNFFHLSIDDLSGTIIGMDQGTGTMAALKVKDDGGLDHLWQKPLAVSARPAIVSDRQQVYATDLVDGRNHLVVLDLRTGDELCRVATPARRATISTIVVSAANEVYFASNEPGAETGLFHRFYLP